MTCGGEVRGAVEGEGWWRGESGNRGREVLTRNLRNERGLGCRICEIRGGSDLGKNVYEIGGVAPNILRNERGSLLRAITG